MRRKYKILPLFMFIVISACSVLCITGCSSKNVSCPDDAEYCVINSDMLKQKGKYYFVDSEGNSVGDSCSIRMQDLSVYDIGEDNIVLTGSRKNNAMIFKRGSSEVKQDFFFLNEPKYTGVSAVKTRGDTVLGLMNGGVLNDTYIDVLVLQSLDGEVLRQSDIEIYARDILDNGSEAVIVGHYYDREKEKHFLAEIVKYDFDNPEQYGQYKYGEHYSEFVRIIPYGEYYLCIAKNLYSKANTIAIINKNTFELEDEIVFSDDLGRIKEKDGRIYVLGLKGLYEVNIEEGDYTRRLKFDDYADSYSAVAVSYFLDDKCYAFLRHGKVANGDINEYGYMLKIDMDTFEVESRTPITSDKRTTLEIAFVLPASYMRENE